MDGEPVLFCVRMHVRFSERVITRLTRGLGHSCAYGEGFTDNKANALKRAFSASDANGAILPEKFGVTDISRIWRRNGLARVRRFP